MQRRYWSTMGRSDEVYASELFEALLVNDTAREFSGHTESSQSMGNRHCTGDSKSQTRVGHKKSV
jgi:hypothetical protein